MTALTAARDTQRYGQGVHPPLLKAPMADTTVLFQGAMAAINSTGKMVPTSADVTLKVVGRARATFDNNPSVTGGMTGEAERGVYYLANDTGNPIAATDLWKLCYAVDDQTVSISSSNGTRPVAGRIVDFDTVNGVAVALGSDAADEQELPPVVILTDNTGASGTHDDTLADGLNSTAPAAITDYPAVVTLTNPVTKTEGETMSAALALAVDELTALRATVATMQTDAVVQNQNASDLAQKVIELRARLVSAGIIAA